MFKEFERICTLKKAMGPVLEIGATPDEKSLLNMKCLPKDTERIGINLDGPHDCEGFTVLKGNANTMGMFEDGHFGTVLCNAVLEHDKFFWKSIKEMQRVTRTGGLILISVPSYTSPPREKAVQRVLGNIPLVNKAAASLIVSTATYKPHSTPGDYYRFSISAVKEVLFEGMVEVEVKTLMYPPRAIGYGKKP